jgi:hypothetical protein
MWKDFKSFDELPKRYDFMRLKHHNIPIYSLEEIKTLYIIMALKLNLRDVPLTAYHLEIDTKTVRKYYLKNVDLFERIELTDAMFFFYGSEFCDISALDDSLVIKRGRKKRYSY